MKTRDDRMTLANRGTIVLSCLAFATAVGANVVLFCILAMARTEPAPVNRQQYEPMRIVALDVPDPTSIETAGPEMITDVVQLGPAPTDTEQPQPAADMSSSLFPPLAERLSEAVFQLPGVPVNPSNVSLFSASQAVPASGVERPVSVSRVDRLPYKSGGPMPRYPQWARRAKLEAAVTVRFIVTAEGAVEDVNIHEIEGDERLGREAVRVISQWHFNPAIKGGKPIACWCFQKVNFTFTR